MKSSVRIVTDSTCDLSEDTLQRYNIEKTHLRVCFGNHEYTDGINLKKDRFYELLSSSDAYPVTSQPPPADFVAVYNKIKKEGFNEIISLHISSGLSGTINAAMIAADALGNQGLSIEIIDSKTTSIGLGFLAIKAAELSLKGEGLSAIRRRIEADIQKIKIYFAVPSLSYLQKGGRIGRLKTLLGELTHTIPILAIKNGRGEVEAIKKCRSTDYVKELVNMVKLEDEVSGIESLCIAYSPPAQNLAELESELRRCLPKVSIGKEMGGCVIGSHTGPSALGTAILTH